MTDKQKKCSGAHCRCMNLGGQCPNIHPSECIEHCPELVAKMKHNTTTEEKCDHVYRTLENINGISGKTTYDKRCMFCGEVAHTPDSMDWEKEYLKERDAELKLTGVVTPEFNINFIRKEKALSRAEGIEKIMNHKFNIFSAKTALMMGNEVMSQIGEEETCIKTKDLIEFLASLTPKEDKL